MIFISAFFKMVNDGILHFTKLIKRCKNIVLGDALGSALEKFVWILNHVLIKAQNLVSVYSRSIKLAQMTRINMTFYVVASVYPLVETASSKTMYVHRVQYCLGSSSFIVY